MTEKTSLWMPLYWGDYFKDTFHLTTEEHGAYFLLMGYYWQNGKIQRDVALLKNITRLSEKKLGRVMKFFRIDGAYYIHDRIESEIKQAIEMRKKKSEAGKKGMEARYNKATNSVITEQQQSYNQSQSQSPIDDDDKRKQFIGISLEIQKILNTPLPVNTQRIYAWLDGGADKELILETLRTIVARKKGDPPSSLNYFDKAIADAVAAKNNPLPQGNPNGTKQNNGQYNSNYAKKSLSRTLAEQLERINSKYDEPAYTAGQEGN